MVLSEEFRRKAADWAALPMFVLSLSFLIIVAIAIVLFVDVHYFLMGLQRESAGQVATNEEVETAPQVNLGITEQWAKREGTYCLVALALIWPVFILELLVQYVARDRSQPFFQTRYMSIFVCLCPPLRMCARNRIMDGKIWFPAMGWQKVDDDLRERLEKMFSVPMIFIALTILPILLIEFRMRGQVLSRPWLQIFVFVGTGVIWFAFAAEFIVMVSVAEKKLRYCRQHWLDLAIILLPLIAFLRSLRVVRAMRMARFAKIQQLSRMGRLYRLRGLALRAVRALMILQLLNKVFRIGPERQLKKLNLLLEEKEKEISLLRRDIARLERMVEEEEKKKKKAEAEQVTAQAEQEGTEGAEETESFEQEVTKRTEETESFEREGMKRAEEPE